MAEIEIYRLKSLDTAFGEWGDWLDYFAAK